MAKTYEPQRGSAAYAILVGMHFEILNGNSTHTKDEIVSFSNKWSNAPLVKDSKAPSSGRNDPRLAHSYYDGWSTMNKTLIPKNLVGVINRKPNAGIVEKMYFLTDAGEELASGIVSRYSISKEGPTLLASIAMKNRTRSDELEKTGLEEENSGQNGNRDVVANAKAELSKPVVYIEQEKDIVDNLLDESLDEVEYVSLAARLCQKRPLNESLLDRTSQKRPAIFLNPSVAVTGKPGMRKLADAHNVSCAQEVVASQGLNSATARQNSDSLIVGTDTLYKSTLSSNPRRLGIMGRPASLCLNNSFADVTPLQWTEYAGAPSWWTSVDSARVVTDEFSIVLLYDRRESRKLGDFLATKTPLYAQDMRRHGIEVLVEGRDLKVGDFMWVARHKTSGHELVLDHIAERKSYLDLWHSIAGTKREAGSVRYYEQKRRLVLSGLGNRYYVIEGDRGSLAEAMSVGGSSSSSGGTAADGERRMKTITGAMVESQLEGFLLLRTANALETVMQMLSLTRRLCLSRQLGQLSVNLWMVQPQYKKIPFDEFNAKMGIQKKTLRQLSRCMLYQVPSLGVVAVDAISHVFPTLAHLASALRTCSAASSEADRRRDQILFVSKAAHISLEKATNLCEILTGVY